MTEDRHNTLHYMNCLQGLQFGMNRVLHVSAKKTRRFAAAGLASRSQMEFLGMPTVLLGPADEGLAGSRPCSHGDCRSSQRAGIELQISSEVVIDL